MLKSLFKYLLIAVFASFIVIGCGEDGSDGAAGPAGPAGKDADPQEVAEIVLDNLSGQFAQDLAAAATPEQCAICHQEGQLPTGADHQDLYAEVGSGNMEVTIDNYSFIDNGSGGYDVTVNFTVKKDGQPITQKPERVTIYVGKVDANGTVIGVPVGLGAADPVGGVITATGTVGYNIDKGFIYAYFTDEKITEIPADKGHLGFYKYIANVGEKIGVWTYNSTANVSACQNCHGDINDNYMKHGYRAAKVEGFEDFFSCKACHYDERDGGHQEWQAMADDLKAYIEGTYDKDNYPYKAILMNDVHMSHYMEFAYPAPKKNCVTCHEGKLDQVLADENFREEVCKSCHPVNGYELGSIPDYRGAVSEIGTKRYALKTLMDNGYPDHSSVLGTGINCTLCHNADTKLSFKDIHKGYDTTIYYAQDKKYADDITVKIDNATFDSTNATLTVEFIASATDNAAKIADMSADVLLGFYGWDTKDFLIGGHSYEEGAGSPVNGKWTITIDLGSDVMDAYAAGKVKRVEIAVMPILEVNGAEVALNSPSRTFNLVDKAFDTAFNTGKEIVDVEKCNACHEALAVTFHSPDRSGNIITCRICHEPTNGAAHLEMQSRSLDSYVHAIHSMQYLDAAKVVEDTFTADKYPDPDFAYEAHKFKMEEHTEEFFYPYFTTLACESCHKPGTYNVPDQSKSMPGKISSYKSNYPVTVTGPAARACGSCHKAEKINEQSLGELATINAHFEEFGYNVDLSSDSGNVIFNAVVEKIMSYMK